MVKKQAISNTLIDKIAALVIIGLIGGVIIAYFTSSDPVFYLEDSNNYGFNNDKADTLNLNLYNKGNVHGFAILCLSSKEFVIKTNNGDFVHQYCFNEFKVPSRDTGLMVPLKTTVKPDANIFNDIQNATIQIDVTCSQKIWSLFPKKCDTVTSIYNYKKDGDRFNKIT